MKTLYLIRGASGSGKSTLADILLDSTRITGNVGTIAADDYFETSAGYIFDPTKLPAAHKWCQERTEEAMKHSYNAVIVHNTFTRQWEMQPYRDLATKYGYTVFEIICNNRFENVHNVPDEIVNKQRDRMEY